MKIILIRSGGGHRALTLSRARLATFVCLLMMSAAGGVGYVAANWQADAVDQEVVAKWRDRLRAQGEYCRLLLHVWQSTWSSYDI